jgi:ABC-type uncharacterized transport system ATPase subunit
MAEELFRMEGISKSFPGVKALDNVSFAVNKGEVRLTAGGNNPLSGVSLLIYGKRVQLGTEGLVIPLVNGEI